MPQHRTPPGRRWAIHDQEEQDEGEQQGGGSSRQPGVWGDARVSTGSHLRQLPEWPTDTVTTGQPSTKPPANQGPAHKPSTPGPSASLPAKAKAYGRYCQGESKKHVTGQKGTQFSQCVTAMAKIATHKAKSPQAACNSESKKHVAGQKGTPFSLCVSGAAKLLGQQSSSSSTTAA